MNSKSKRTFGFSLVELLVAVAVIAIAMGMALSLPSADRRRAAVIAASEELAGTLRLARALAIERQEVFAVVFHIQNGAGTSGLQINNWDGEHGYRILGPDQVTGLPGPPTPDRLNVSYGVGWNVVKCIRATARSWVGEMRRLPARRVRFLALTDQDNGHAHIWDDAGATYGRYPDTYPRPWCGWYDAVQRRLRPWGGYDPALVDGAGRVNGGFYWQGQDGTIAGSRTPAGRTRISTLTRTEAISEVVADGATTLLTAGAPRPLVNAAWQDCRLVFRPDGRVEAAPFLELRYWSRRAAPNGGGNAISGFGDLGDLHPNFRDWNPPGLAADQWPGTWFQPASGFWWFTLAPDIAVDDDRFPDARSAAASLMPAWRVGISRLGEVRMQQVRTTLDGRLDALITDWQDRLQTRARYARGMRSDAAGRIEGRPVDDALVPEMLERRAWWYAP